jgi:hypothetical protein
MGKVCRGGKKQRTKKIEGKRTRGPNGEPNLCLKYVYINDSYHSFAASEPLKRDERGLGPLNADLETGPITEISPVSTSPADICGDQGRRELSS